MKKALCAALIICLLAGCGAKPSDNADPFELPQGLPESCYLYADHLGESVQLDLYSNLPMAEGDCDGRPEYGVGVTLKNGAQGDLILQEFQDGFELEDIVEGAVECHSYVRGLIWNERQYGYFELSLDNATIPGFRSSCGGILVIRVSGDCKIETMDGFDGLEGFDSVIVTGDGSLTLNGGSGSISAPGSGRFPLPALLLDGPTLRFGYCDIGANSAPGEVPLYLQTGGSMQADFINLSGAGDICVAGGSFCVGGLGGKAKTCVFRSGVSYINSLEADNCLVLVNGGDVFIDGALPQNTAIETALGLITAASLSERDNLSVHGGAAIDAGSNEDVFRSIDWSPENCMLCDSADGTEFLSNALTQSGGLTLRGALTLDGARLRQLSPWGALVIETTADSSVINDADDRPAVIAPTLVLRGGGTLTVDGQRGISIWTNGDDGAPAFILTDGARLEVLCEQESIVLGSESGESGAFTVESGSLFSAGDVWLENASFTLLGGSVSLPNLGVGSGEILCSGGELSLDGIWIGEGDVVIDGGEITVGDGGICADNGNIIINGGTLRIPGGKDALIAQNGKVKVKGGDIIDSNG